MDLLFIFAGSLFSVWILRNSIYWVYLWQTKEYRLDRLIIHLLETVQGRNLFFSPLSLLKWLGTLLYIFVIFEENYLPYFHLFVTAIFAFQALFILQELLHHRLSRPEFTPKALSVMLTSFVLAMILFTTPLMDKFFWLLVIDRLLPLVVAFFVFVHSFPTELYRDAQIRHAIRKINKHPDLKVIGVTGSYGKTSTKEYIVQILRKKFDVITTYGNHHTLSGIAQVVNETLTKKTQIFVAEIGTYGKSEIAQIAYVIRPTIAILTGINDQHLSLFKTLKTSIDAKYELITSLPKNGLAIFNGNDTESRKLYQRTKKPKILFGRMNEDKKNLHFDIFAKDIIASQNDVIFTVHLEKKIFSVKAPLLGSHAIEHLLPAIFIADFLGMTENEIKYAVLRLSPPPNTLRRQITKRGLILIDDTFNSNPESVASAIDYLSVYRKKKFLIFQPMIELGGNARAHHYTLGKNIAYICTAVLLTNKNYQKDIQKGIADAGGACTVITGSTRSLSIYLQSNAKKGDVVVCEGSEAREVMEKLLG